MVSNVETFFYKLLGMKSSSPCSSIGGCLSFGGWRETNFILGGIGDNVAGE